LYPHTRYFYYSFLFHNFVFLLDVAQEPDLADKFVDGWPEDTLSMASIQGLFMRFKTDPVGAYNFLPRMIEETRRRSDAHKAEQRRRQEEHTQKLRELMESQ
jgi:hypothetical protein